ncbi:hypothetical protein [Brevundimonas sp.]|uniref:hypothetical protein n=1 Tax=Brevundimonas sp. TaxID=1871086 RepID=UPI001AD5CFAC|nr:hypothetical protein [Brevundimonas sp.]MBN9466595.1 hypothetical protein [Brevundimonas sp.]
MRIERLQALAEAYGGDLRRWPADQRAFAESLVAADPAARALLDEAAALDALLDASPSVAPSADLTARVLRAAPGARAKSRPRRAVWLLGAGWAAAACAGVIAGVGLTRQMSADARADAVLYQATLSGVDDTEVLG